MSPDDRRPFRGAPYERNRTDRPMGGPVDRNDRPPTDRPGFNGPRPFVRPPTRGGDMPPPDHSVRLRDGDREVEISGNPAFVRQVLDDLPVLMARLRGDAPGRTAITMPAPPAAVEEVPAASVPQASEDPEQPGAQAQDATTVVPAGGGSLEDQILEVLKGSSRPLPIAAIRQRLDADVSGQQVRRLLEKAVSQVSVSSDKPAAYSLR